MADASLLKQLIWNVVINGIEAMNENGGVLSIKTGQRGNKIFIKISDTGVGMSKEKQAKLFTPFFTDKPFGTGLGLTLVKRIMYIHNGEIEVQSEEGKGSEFTFFFSAITN
jgi:two-component system sporulation sensor kinase B